MKHEICDCVKGSNRGQIVTRVIVVILVLWTVILVKDHPTKVSMVSQLWLQLKLCQEYFIIHMDEVLVLGLGSKWFCSLRSERTAQCRFVSKLVQILDK